MIADITEEEVLALPLPPNWIKSISTNNTIVYKNTVNKLEMGEHPILSQALQLAKNEPLPLDWAIQETVLENGVTDIYYINKTLGVSLWDPPSLRRCLSVCLSKHGFKNVATTFMFEEPGRGLSVDDRNTGTQQQHQLNHVTSDSLSAVDTMQCRDPVLEAKPGGIWMTLKDNLDKLELSDDSDCDDVDQGLLLNSKDQTTDVGVEKQASTCNPEDDDYDSQSEMSTAPSATDGSTSKDRSGSAIEHLALSAASTHPASKLFDSYVKSNGTFDSIVSELSRLITKDSDDVIFDRMLRAKPPRSEAGIQILMSDTEEINIRLHEHLALLRYTLAAKDGYVTSFANSINNVHVDDRLQSACNLASAIATNLRHDPLPIIYAIDININDEVLPHLVAYIVVHRLLHPISTDSSTTSALLLEAFNFRKNQVLGSFADILSPEAQNCFTRMLFVNDRDIAMNWNPILEPMPMAPHGVTDNTFTCLLKAYAIRSDVSAFLTTAWKHLIPTMFDFLKLEAQGQKVPMSKIFVLSARLLDVFFSHEVLVVLPSTATVICQAIHSMCGTQGVHNYFLYFLVLPNLVKILTGDYNSIENEEVFRGQSIVDLSRKYFDLDIWWPLPDNVARKQVSQSVVDIVWLVWRLYSGAAFINDPLNTTLSNQDFFEASPCSDYSGIFDVKIRNQLHKLHRKFDAGIDLLLHMPLDIYSPLFLGSEAYAKLKEIDDNFESRGALRKRLFAVMTKPQHVVTTLVVSKAELGTLFVEIILALEKVGDKIDPTLLSKYSILSRTITEYLVTSDDVVQHAESILLLKCDVSSQPEDEVVVENIIGILQDLPKVKRTDPHTLYLYERLHRSLRIALKQDSFVCTAIKYISADTNFSDSVGTMKEIFYSPEFDQHYSSKESETVTVFEKITHSWNKKSKATKMKVLRGGELISVNDESLSLAAHVKAFPSKLRFDTIGSNSIKETSLGGRNPISPKKSSGMLKKTNLDNFSTFTKIDVNPKSSFLETTESYRHKNDISSRRTQQDIDRDFMLSMRSHRPIPTKKFANRRNLKMSSNLTNSYQIFGTHTTVAQPFPEHLRLRSQSPVEIEEFTSGEIEKLKRKIMIASRLSCGALFDKIDSRSSGLISVEEFGAAISRLLPKQISERQARKLMRSIDMRGDGAIDRDEFIEFMNLSNTSEADGNVLLGDEGDDEEEEEVRQRSRSPELSPDAHFRIDTASFKSHLSERDNALQQNRLHSDLMSGFVPGLRRASGVHLRVDANKLYHDATESSREASNGTQDLYKYSQVIRGNEDPHYRPPFEATRRRAPPISRARSPRARSPSPTQSLSQPVTSTYTQKSSKEVGLQRELDDYSDSSEIFSTPVLSSSHKLRENVKETVDPNSSKSQSLSAPSTRRRSQVSNTSDTIGRIAASGAYTANPGLYSTEYSQVLPCKSEEAERLVERQKKLDSIAKLRKRLEDNQEKDTNCGDQYDGIRSIPAPSDEYKKVQQTAGSSQSNDFDEASADAKKSRRVAAPILKRSFASKDVPDISDFIRDGISVVKHGRTGAPKTRRLVFEPESKELRWKSEKETRRSVLGRIFLSTDEHDYKKMAEGIKISDITKVQRGIHTDVLFNATLVDPACCLSIITSSRTLDLAFESNLARNNFFRTIEQLISSFSLDQECEFL